MTASIAVVMDPIDSINPRKDSTLAMLLAAQRRGWTMWVLGLDGLHLQEGQVRLAAARVEVADDVQDWFRIVEQRTLTAADLDVVLMRKDPPFDMEYIYATYLLEHLQRQGVLVANRPQGIRDCNEKLFATEFPDCTPPLVVSRDVDALRGFHGEHGDVVFKPLDGMGGASIFRVREDDPNLSVILETLTDHGSRRIMGQRYLPEIRDGDTRILLIDGVAVPYGLARVPAAGESRGNLAAGGSGVGRALTERDRFICEQVGPVLRERGLLFVGIDVIGDYLTEINVTCPTCIRELDKIYGLDIAGDFMACLVARLEQRDGTAADSTP